MLEKILKLYTTYMAYDVRSPMPHVIGPPGCGKSTIVEQAAQLIGVNLHVINVSRLSPLEIEGVQMPVDMDTMERRLHLLLNDMWAKLKEGDIVLWDEFLRGFPEVYNGLLDIFTARNVRGHVLPKVFMIGASNSAVAYDGALEDRLLHLPVADPRTDRKEKARLCQIMVDALGLYPDMNKNSEMISLMDTVVLPMFDILDSFKMGATSAPTLTKGKSIRNLIGQVQLREIQTSELREMIDMNNRMALQNDKAQYVVLPEGKKPPANYEGKATKLPVDKLTRVQATNLDINLQLIGMETIRMEKEGTSHDEPVDDDLFA